ncbi:uncharacterized protein LOC123467404 [Daphnia magna]|uniref:uncharacterized protein LOC123467404 n=1 Tax=Daphnia magna TaxID=35525 RepID=UPI001E1BBCE9|nr:uncharacterized protein LOC123467404 [Daphnia magna]
MFWRKSSRGKDVKDFDEANGKDLINQLVEIFAIRSASKNESSEWLDQLNSEKEWTPKLQVLVKETCKAFLLPKTTIKDKDKYGRKIIFIKGVSVFVSKMIEEMKRLKEKYPELQEIQIVGLSSVHVDCHLENETWHGTNVGIVTDKIVVDSEVCRKGQQNNAQAKEETTVRNATSDVANNFSFCWDVSGVNGEPGQPGKSGGNVNIICNEIINAERWKIISDGGKGGDGQNGSNGESKSDGRPRKWSKECFKKVFPSMSTFNKGEQTTDIAPEDTVNTVLTNLMDRLPVENRTYGKDIKPDYRGTFFIEGTAKDGSKISLSFYQSMTERHTLIFCQGSNIGQGGYGGTITFEFITGKDSFAIESRVPVVGKDDRRPRAVRMGVYEAMGYDGEMGTPVGDVAFIHSLNTNKASANENPTGHYIGFENNVSLRMERNPKKPTRQQNDPENYYTKLSNEQYASIVYRSLPAYGQVQPLHSTVVNATKKKVIVRQSLAKHVFQVDERKQMLKCLRERLFSNWEKEKFADNVDLLVSQMRDKETQLHQLMSQCSRGLDNVGSVRFVKSAKTNWNLKSDVISVSDTSHSLGGRRSVGRRPVDFRKEPPVDIRCLDMLATMSGANSAIHSIFGRMNSNGMYICDDVVIARIRASITTFIREEKNRDNVSGFIKQFVLRVQKSDVLDCPVANDVKVAYFKFRRTNSEKREFNWQSATEFEDLYEEYAKFVKKPSNPVESAELEMLAIIKNRIIHVYTDQSSSFKWKESLNPDDDDDDVTHHCVLHKENGEFQRVEQNKIIEDFCMIHDDDLFKCPPIQSEYFCKFLDSLVKHRANQQFIASMKRLNPANGDTPDKLFQLLLKRCQRNDENPDDFDVKFEYLYSIDPCWLAEWIEEHNSRNLSPIFYLNIVKAGLPVEWIRDSLMHDICDRFTKDDFDDVTDVDYDDVTDVEYDVTEDDYDVCGPTIRSIKDCVEDIVIRMPFLVLLLRKLIATSDSCSALQPKNLVRLLKLIAKDFKQGDGITSQQLPELQLLPLSDWFYHLKSKKWERRINLLSIRDLNTEKENKNLKKEAVYLLLELESQNGEDHCDKLLKEVKELKTAVILLQDALHSKATPSQEYDERNIDDIIKEMEKDMPQNNESRLGMSYHTSLATVKKNVEESKSMSDQMKKSEKRIKKLVKQWQKNGLELNDKSVVEFVYVYDYAIQKTCTKEGDKQIFQLRDTQRVAIITLLTSKEKTTLTQVSTGEGKSLIVTGVAIAFALCRNEENKNKKIDVITSNDVLARCDSVTSVADGGLRELYEYFKVSVENNCSQWVDERTLAYNAEVVYGQLANFQRDYLLDTFYGYNIRGDRTMDLVLIDEVDCMLLDRGNNVLYLSHDIPGMEMLESLYVFIWEKMRSSSIGSDKLAVQELVKSAVLHDLYGVISKDDLESISDSLKDKPSEKNALWDHLIETKVINSQGHLLIEGNIENIKFKPQMDPKIQFYLRSVAKRERNIQIPTHLMSFVELHVDTWINNAMKALELQRDEDYVVDQDRTDTSPDLNPQVIIIDKDTGIDQISSQWDGALHQFIQLKEGCKLTSQSLKASFIADSTYIQTYVKVSAPKLSYPEYIFKIYILNNFRAALGLPELKTTDTSWMTPVRSLALAKHLAVQKSSQSQSRAVEILNRVIASKDSSLYPAAHYYLAFILFKEDFKDNKNTFIQILQTCETILNNHINMHLSFYLKVAHAAPEQTPSFCVVDAYKQQKNNMVKILEYFIGSVRALLGSHYCSASNLKEAGRDPPEKLGVVKMKMKEAETFIKKKIASHIPRFQKKRKLNDEPKRHKIHPEKADKLFQSLVKEECITCQLNDIHTVPNRNAIIQEVADEYGINKLLENLESVFGENLIEEQIEKKLKEKNLIPCTRKAFWEKLKEADSLEAVKGGLCFQMKCVIMLESECDVEPSKPNSQKLDRDRRINIEDFQFGLESFDRKHNCLNVLYNPIYDSTNDLLKQKKIMFSKQYVIKQLGEEEYRRRKEKFESNQIAQLNLNKLEKKVSLKFSDPLGKHDLERIDINCSGEQDGVWNALVKKKIIKKNGKLLPNFQKFSYPECPAYEKPVMRMIGRTFVAEIVKSQWLRLKTDKDPNCLKAINLLPLKPYRDMLGDLMAAHVISGARVTENTKLIEEKTDALEDEDERECVRKFLKSRQAVYAPKMKKYDVYLDFIEMDIRKIPNTENISTELHSFDLVGFNHVIDIKDREMSWKTYLSAIGTGAVGIASIGGGVFLIHANLLSFGLIKNVFFMGGASDILYAITAILTRSNFSWADYTRQRLMSAIGKAEPMDMIKTIFKLYSSTEKVDFREAIQLAVGKERWKRQGRSQTDRDSEVSSELKKHKTEFYFHSQLHDLLQDFGIFVHGKIKKCLDKNLNEIRKRLTQFNNLHGLETTQHFVREKMNKFISDWATEGRKWVKEITTAMTSKLDEIHMVLQQTEEIPLTQEIADNGIREMKPIFHDYEVRIRLIRVTVTCISEFLSDLKNYDKPKVARVEDIGVEEAFKRFQERMLADIEAELERQVDKILDSLRKKIHRVASKKVSNLAKINSEIFTFFLQFT